MIIRVTGDLITWLRCKRKQRLGGSPSAGAYGYAKIVPQAAFNLGTAIHHGLEEWAKGNAPIPAYSMFCADVERRMSVIYKHQNGVAISNAELEPMLTDVGLGVHMLSNYENFWKTPLPPDFVSIAPEQRVTVPIPGTEHFLTGKMDGILVDKHNRLFVLDHKTFKNRPRKEIVERSTQFIAYIWILQQLAEQNQWDMPVEGLAYNGLWKRAEVPTKVDNRKGTMADLFPRFLVTPSADEIAEFAEELPHIANEIADKTRFVTHHRTTDGSCEWGCSFNELCFAMSRRENTDHILQTDFIRTGEDKIAELLAEPEDE